MERIEKADTYNGMMIRPFLVLMVASGGCTPVTQSQRQVLADPAMQLSDDPLEDVGLRKLELSREGAVGGDSKAAGGGCSCGN